VKVFVANVDSLNLEGPKPLRSPPNVIPPLGPKAGVAKICGEEAECFKLRLWSMEGNFGEAIESPRLRVFAEPVLRLNKLGFFLGFNAGGLMKEGDEGSDV
jgi:hypothetical protein